MSQYSLDSAETSLTCCVTLGWRILSQASAILWQVEPMSIWRRGANLQFNNAPHTA